MSGRLRREPLDVVYGIHPVLELLESRGREVDRLFVALERRGGLGRILRLAREAGIPVSRMPREALARRVGRGAVHQGIAAQVAPLPYADVVELCEQAARGHRLVVLLDGVVDPRNLGAILRTSAAAGVDGVILVGEGSVGLGPTVAKVAAGAADRIPVAREAKPGQRLEALRRAGFQALALDPAGPTRWDEVDLTRGTIVVAGGEKRGARPSVTRACDARVSIRLAAGVESLNVSVALGVLLFEAVRQRRAAGLERA